MLPALLVTAARTGGTDLYEKLYEAAKAESDRKVRGALLSAMGAFPEKKLVERNLELLLSDEFSFREAASVLRAPMEDPALRQFVYDHVKTNYDAISEKLPKMAKRRRRRRGPARARPPSPARC
jgi:hypothetical protein